MKRLLLWTMNVLFLMVLSASYAGPQDHGLRALSVAKLDNVTAGNCSTCNQYPYIEYEGWDLIRRSESAHTVIARRVIDQLVNPTAASTSQKIGYSDGCSYRWTGGSASVGSSIGISFNRTYQCDQPKELQVHLPPRTSVTLYEGTKRYYITETYRHYMQWSDGYRELSGATETFRREYTYRFLELN